MNQQNLEAIKNYFRNRFAWKRSYTPEIIKRIQAKKSLPSNQALYGLSCEEEQSFIDSLDSYLKNYFKYYDSIELINDYQPQFHLRTIIERSNIISISKFSENSGLASKLIIILSSDSLSIMENGKEILK